MADWTGYVGMVTGVVGMVMGCQGYRRSNQIKALDLRLELRKKLGEAHLALSIVRDLVDFADRSRQRVFAATGMLQSGSQLSWAAMVETDRNTINRLESSLRDEAADYAELSAEQLESEIVSAHRIKTELDTLMTNYRSEVAADDRTRERLQQQAAARVNRAAN